MSAICDRRIYPGVLVEYVDGELCHAEAEDCRWYIAQPAVRVLDGRAELVRERKRRAALARLLRHQRAETLKAEHELRRVGMRCVHYMHADQDSRWKMRQLTALVEAALAELEGGR